MINLSIFLLYISALYLSPCLPVLCPLSSVHALTSVVCFQLVWIGFDPIPNLLWDFGMYVVIHLPFYVLLFLLSLSSLLSFPSCPSPSSLSLCSLFFTCSPYLCGSFGLRHAHPHPPPSPPSRTRSLARVLFLSLFVLSVSFFCSFIRSFPNRWTYGRLAESAKGAATRELINKALRVALPPAEHQVLCCAVLCCTDGRTSHLSLRPLLCSLLAAFLSSRFLFLPFFLSLSFFPSFLLRYGHAEPER